jgi:CxxC-x17-CxxC domain-containing protein
MGYEDFQRERNERPSGGRFGGRSDDRRGGGRSFGGGRGGFGGGRDRRSMDMCDAVCAKCGKDCKVPFKPTGDKPVFCSDCFEKQGNTRNPVAAGVSQEQFDQLNNKLDKILEILNSLEMIEEESEDEEGEVSEDVQ